MKIKFTKDLIPTGKTQEKHKFTLKPKLNKPLSWRKRKLKQEMLQSVKVANVIENMSKDDEEKED
jgi:hypothetical protein